MNRFKTIIATLLLFSSTAYGDADTKTLFFISNSHLDTQWNWDVKTTIDEYVRNTMVDNFRLFEKYPAFMLNFEGAIRYKWMKEYYPAQYETLKKYIASGQWHVSGCGVDANDVMVSSAESIMRNWLYGNTFYMQEFGVRGGYDIMLPDCFGFSYALPSLASHCGMKGFHTAKLGWGSAQYDRLPSWGIWQGVDGSRIYAIYKPHAYDSHEDYNKDNSHESWAENAAQDNYDKYGLAAEIRYVGPRSDHGGALGDNAGDSGNNTPYWLNYSVNSDGPVKVVLATPDQIFDYFENNDHSRFHVYDGELPLITHGVGAYTSQSMLKRWNRRNELLADAAEKSSVTAEWLGATPYRREALREAWTNNLWQAHHDGITGTSIPKAYVYSMNEYTCANKTFADVFENAVGATARSLDTRTEGMAAVVYNPLSFERTDVAEARVACSSRPEGVRAFGPDGKEVLAQVVGYDHGEATVIFAATVPSLGYAVYDLRLGETCTLTSDLTINTTSNTISNGKYRTTLDAKGDPILYDTSSARPIMLAPEWQLLRDESGSFPAWEITYDAVKGTPYDIVEDNVEISVAEDGPLRKAFRVKRTSNGSTFVHYIRMSAVSDRIDVVNEVDWQTRETLLKMSFRLRSKATKATYDISLGTIERGYDTSSHYEMQGHQWADLSADSGQYGVSILNDCKYGWDMPGESNLRLTLIHTPRPGGYAYQGLQDLGANQFTVSLFPHSGKWSEATQKEASKLNQPFAVFSAPKYEGGLGKEFSFLRLDSDAVSVKAMKKSETGDEIIVRVYEWKGEDHDNLTMTFPADIISARQVNGIEESLPDAPAVNVSGSKLTFSIRKYQPLTFALRLAAAPAALVPDETVNRILPLDYNADIMSGNGQRGDATVAFGTAYPAELIPDELNIDGVTFSMGSRADGVNNVVRAMGQKLTLDREDGCDKLYILAASASREGSDAMFKVGDKEVRLTVPYMGGYVGQAETQFNNGAQYRRDEVALTATHSHNIASKSDVTYDMLYIYKYMIALPEDAVEIELPDDPNLCIFAATMSDNKNDDTRAAMELRNYHDYKELGTADSEDFGHFLVPDGIAVSGYVNANEAGKFASDGDASTKWCCTSANSWIEYRFNKPVTVLRWGLLNAGCEGLDKITRSFKVQYYADGRWNDIFTSTDNTTNRLSGSVEAVEASRFRLFVAKGEQGGNTARIYEFSLYGRYADESGIADITVAPEYGIELKGNTPNPCHGSTSVLFRGPDYLRDVVMHVYDLTGRRVMTSRLEHSADAAGYRRADVEISLIPGCYIYRLEGVCEGRTVVSDAARLICK